MANTVITTTTLDGPKDIILHVYIKSDGSGVDLQNELIVDPDDLEMPADSNYFTIKTIQSSLDGFSARLRFEYLIEGTWIWVLPEDMSCFDFTTLGGLRDRSGELDGTGRVLLSTRGLGTGDEGSFVIKMSKS